MRRPLLVVAVPIVSVLLTVGLYLFLVKHAHVPLAPPLLRLSPVRRYLEDPRLARLADLIHAREEAGGYFTTRWGPGSGVLLSHELFVPLEMFGLDRYRYKPNLRKLMFVASTPMGLRSFETEDTPEVRRLAEEIGLHLQPATYDHLGFRDVDPELRADCDARVLFLGDSFTDGVWVANDQTFVNRYGHLARDGDPRVNVCPQNAGVDGYGTMEEAFILRQLFEPAGSPGLVALMFFPNDVDAEEDDVVAGTIADADRKWAESLAYLRMAHQFVRARGSALIVAAIPTKSQVSDNLPASPYPDRLRLFCQAEQIDFIDLLPALRQTHRSDLYLDWDPHFTPAGHEVVAQALYAATKGMLAKSARSKEP